MLATSDELMVLVNLISMKKCSLSRRVMTAKRA